MREHRKERLDPGELTSVGSGKFNKAEPKKKRSSPAYVLIQEEKRLQVKTKGGEKRGKDKMESSAAQLSSCSPGELHKERQAC